MLKYTFCGMGGLGVDAEQMLWRNGVLCWNDFLHLQKHFFSPEKQSEISSDIENARKKFDNLDMELWWFLKKLPVSHYCRLLPHFRHRFLYLDIETTGLSCNDIITTVSIYNGKECRTFIRDIDLDLLPNAIAEDAILVTYNGKSFDIPFLVRELGDEFKRHLHFDLKYILRGWGITGGLKNTEKIMNINIRQEGITKNGLDAIHLWREYQNGDPSALLNLCKYNQSDTIALEKIMIMLYNRSMKNHLFFNL